MFGEEELIKIHKNRSQIIAKLIFFAFAVILSRLWYLQIFKGEILLNYSLKNRLRKEIARAPRGMMFSRDDVLLVDNIPRFDAILIPQYLRKKEETLKNLSEVLGISVPNIKKTLKKNSGQARYRPIIIKKNISRKEVAILETENFRVPGVFVDTFISREYKQEKMGAHLFGYISEISKEQLPKYRKRDKILYGLGDFIGQFGLEYHFDQDLRGENGHEFVEVDALGRKKNYINTDNLFTGIDNKKSTPGRNFQLTIDSELQEAAFNALDEKTGSAVAINVKTGEVLAMVSRPSFEPSRFSKGLTSEYWTSLITNKDNPLRDRTIQEHYAPGSTFKTFTAIAALEEGIINEKTKVTCRGRVKFGSRTYNCWKRWGHGEVDVVKSLRESCDVFFYKIAMKLDIDVLSKYARLFGLGYRTGIELPREETGLLPTKEWKNKRFGEEWQPGETLSCVIGQSYMLTTPLQLALSYSAIANGGKLYKPYLVSKISTYSGETIKTFSPELKSEVKISEKTLKLINKGLYQVVNHPKGTVWWKRGSKGNQMAGKTGTSQVIRMSKEKLFSKCIEHPKEERHHALFVGFAPFDDPEIAVSAVVEHGCSGSSTASPVVSDIITAYMKKYHPERQEKYKKIEQKQFSKFITERNRLRKEKEEQEKEDEVDESDAVEEKEEV